MPYVPVAIKETKKKTRLFIKKLMNNLILAKIIKGKIKGEEVLIPRIPVIPADFPFQFKRIPRSIGFCDDN